MKTFLFISYLIALLLSAFEFKQTNQSNDTENQIIWKSGDNDENATNNSTKQDDEDNEDTYSSKKV